MVSSLFALLDDPDEHTTHLAVAFDNPIRSFRNDLFAGYKTEDGMDPDLRAQFDGVEAAVRAMGVVVWSMDRWEADDALATAATRWADDVEQVRVMTPDKDLGQCIRGTRVVQVNRMRKKVIDEDALLGARGVTPASIPDYLALVGDTADGIPGLAGFGEKTASALLHAYGHLEAIPRSAAEWTVNVRGASALAETLAAQMDDARLYRTLATLVRDVPLVETLADLESRGVRRDGSKPGATRLSRRKNAPRAREGDEEPYRVGRPRAPARDRLDTRGDRIVLRPTERTSCASQRGTPGGPVRKSALVLVVTPLLVAACTARPSATRAPEAHVAREAMTLPTSPSPPTTTTVEPEATKAAVDPDGVATKDVPAATAAASAFPAAPPVPAMRAHAGGAGGGVLLDALEGAGAARGLASGAAAAPRGDYMAYAQAASSIAAGEWDDNANYHEFQKWLGTEASVPYRHVDVGHRRFLVVRDEAGRAVPGCRVEVAGNQGKHVSFLTGPSGRALFFPRAEGFGDGAASATATCEGGSVTRDVALDDSGGVVDLRLPVTRSLPSVRTIDVAFILDTTGSMSEEIASVQATIARSPRGSGRRTWRCASAWSSTRTAPIRTSRASSRSPAT